MSPTYLALLNVLLPILLISSTVSAFNITAILEDYPDFSGFNAILNQTGLAAEINRRTTLTILAVDGGALGTISGQPTDVQKRILSVHVILDYYDTTKFKNLKKSSSSLVTLFQTTGKADQRQGFLNMTKINGEIFFGSAMPGSPLNAKFVKTVVAKPYNISVLQVSSVVVPPGISDLKPAPPSPPPPPAAVTAPAPAPSESDKGAPAEAPAADAPGADAPAANAPAADAPAADTPSPAPNAPAADAPKPSKKEEEPADDEKKSDAGRVAVGAGFGVVIMMAGAALLGL